MPRRLLSLLTSATLLASACATTTPAWTEPPAGADWERNGKVEGIRETVEARLSPEEFASAAASLDAAIDVLRRNGRLGGDCHKRNPLLKWMYRGI